MLLRSHGSFKAGLLLFLFFCMGQFCCGVPPGLWLLGANACTMLTVVSTEERQGSRRGSTQGTFPQETQSLAPPLRSRSSSPLPTWRRSYFSIMRHELMLFYISVIICVVLLLFRRDIILMLKLLIVLCDGCCAIGCLLPRASHVRGWRAGERERFGGVFQGGASQPGGS